MYKHGVSRIQTKFRFPRTHIFVDWLLKDSALLFSDDNKLRKLLKGQHYNFDDEAVVQVGTDLYSIRHRRETQLKQFVVKNGRCLKVKTTKFQTLEKYGVTRDNMIVRFAVANYRDTALIITGGIRVGTIKC